MAYLHNIYTGDDEPGVDYVVASGRCPYCGGDSHRDDEDWCEDYEAYQRSIDPTYYDAGEEA